MKTILHPAATRGHANHGWLDSHHTFSFAHYYDPARMNFGVLRVLNDDWVDGGKGFDTHPHDNMEIISIPLVGDLEHRDSMGNRAVIRQNDVQIMSAGTGIYHSEYNHHADKKVNFLQIWVFPKKRNVTPRYDQKTFAPEARVNRLQGVVNPAGAGGGVEINQDAWFWLGSFKSGFETRYNIRQSGNGVYVFVIAGEVTVGEQKLSPRDGYGIWDTDSFPLKATTDAELLLMDVPMK
jgi:redox-sensitive bicupin YhaK (pirin superfamily)